MSNHDPIAALVDSLPAAIRRAVEDRDDDAFQVAYNNLPEMEQLRIAQVFQELQTHMADNVLADYDDDDLPDADTLLASLPTEIVTALHNEDQAALERSFDALDPAEQEQVTQTMMLLQALATRAQVNEQEFRGGEGEIIAAFETLLDAIVDATLDPTLPREEILSTLAELESKEWKLREPVERVWAGERNVELLTNDLDEHDTVLVSYILEALDEQE